jgi:integrase
VAWARQLPSGRWQGQYRDRETGKVHSVRGTYALKKDARDAADEEHSKIGRGVWIDPRNRVLTVGEWASTWLPSKIDLRPSSRDRLRGVLDTHVLPAFGSDTLASVSNSAVRAWVATMPPPTARKSYNALNQMMRAAVADRKIAYNPCADVPLPPVETMEQRFLTVDEVNALAECIEDRFEALVLLGAYGGLRFGELAGLRRKRVDVLRGRVRVHETLSDVSGVLSFGPPKTKRSRREVPLPRSVVRRLEAHLERYVAPRADALVFTGPKGAPLRRAGFRRSWWQPATRAAGCEGFKFHELRHTFVALWVAAGANVKEVSVRAGHSSVAFTLDQYGHLYEDHSDTLAERLDGLLAGVNAR